MKSSAFWKMVWLTVVGAGLSWMTGAPDRAAEVSAFPRTVYLVRHGSYDERAEADPITGPALTPLGIAQARLLASRVRELPVHFDELSSSSLTRAVETAQILHESVTDVPVTPVRPELSECTPPYFRASEKPASAEESACARRLDAAYAQIFVPGGTSSKNEILICHGNVIRYFITRALGVDTRSWIRMSVAHASITVIRVNSDASMTVLSVGDIGHVPPNLQSWGGDGDPELVAPGIAHVERAGR
jgi:serine/threonine-protein phosphatase PGAM5